MKKTIHDMTKADWDRIDAALVPLVADYGPAPLARLVDVMVSKIGVDRGREELDMILESVTDWGMEIR